MPGSSPGMTLVAFFDIRLRDLATCSVRGLHFVCRPRKQRAQGRPGARCTRGLACNCAQRTRTRAYRFSGNTPAFPAQWLYGLLRALPGERLFCHRRRANLLANLTPAPRRQDHTTSPYASHHPRQSWRPRPPQPVPTFVTMADAPLAGQDGDSYSFDLPDGLSGKFLREGLDRLLDVICPSGRFHRLHGPARRSALGNDGAASGANSDKLQLGSWNHCPASLLAS